jgi:hypothetical protein
MASLSIDLGRGDLRPYFLWDEETTTAELRAHLNNSASPERLRLLAKMLREARDTDVWHFVSPGEVAEALPTIARYLGRRRKFWEFLISGWRADELLQ